MTCPKYVLFCNYLPQALHGRADRPRIFHQCTNSAVIRLLDLFIHGRFSQQMINTICDGRLLPFFRVFAINSHRLYMAGRPSTNIPRMHE